jgi:hypothetical protein
MRRLVTVTLAGAILAGCSFSASTDDSDTIDPDWAERFVAKSVEEGYDVRVDSVTCPDGIKPAQGAIFACTANIAGAQLPIKLTIGEVDLGTGNVRYKVEPTKALMDVEGVIETLKNEMQVPETNVDCGTKPYQVIAVGDAMKCTVTEGQERVVFRVVVKDLDGNFDFEAG